MKKVATIGSALVDVFIKSHSFVLEQDEDVTLKCSSQGGKLEVEQFVLRTGGGGSNTAVGFARLGFETTCISETGRDNLSRFVLEDLQAEGVKVEAVVREKKEETGGSVILVCGDGERMILVHRGAASHLDPHDINEQVVKESDWLHLSSLSGRVDTVQHLLELARDGGKAMSWNPGTAALEDIANGALAMELLSPVEVFIVNQQEWQIVKQVQQQLKDQMPFIVVTNGDQGGVVFEGGQEWPYQAKPVDKTIDSTGAGDSFAVGLVAAHLQGRDSKTAVEWASRNAASVVKHFGAKDGLLTADILG